MTFPYTDVARIILKVNLKKKDMFRKEFKINIIVVGKLEMKIMIIVRDG